MSHILSLERLRSLHWGLCAVIAISSTGASIGLSLPVCVGCLCVQGLFWGRLFIKSQRMIALIMMACSGILGILWYQAIYPALTCPFDLSQNIPSCTHLAQDFLGGYPLAAWGCVGSLALGLWAYADFQVTQFKRG